jgi:hypothetical protein
MPLLQNQPIFIIAIEKMIVIALPPIQHLLKLSLVQIGVMGE